MLIAYDDTGDYVSPGTVMNSRENEPYRFVYAIAPDTRNTFGSVRMERMRPAESASFRLADVRLIPTGYQETFYGYAFGITVRES